MLKLIATIVFTAILLTTSANLWAAEKIHFDFEEDSEGWGIPDWAFYQSDHVGRSLEVSSEEASTGESSLKIMSEFPGDVWRAVLIDHVKDSDFTEYETISADVYLPKKAPRNFMQVRLIITAGDGWHFIEAKEAPLLKPGKWITVRAKLEREYIEGVPSEWRGRGHKRLFNHVGKIKKIGVRVEYNASPPHRIGRKYHGPIYVDNIIIE